METTTNRIKEQSTRVYKDFHGWNAETYTTVNDQTFKITTCKTHRGKLHSSAQPGELRDQDNGFQSFQITDMFKGNISILTTDPARVTEKVVREQHSKAVLLFDKMEQAGEVQPVKKDVPEIGDILFLDGYGKSKGCDGNNHILYEIEEGNFGTNYKTVERDTLTLDSKNYVEPFSEKFGIGTYFEPGFKFDGSENDLNNLLIEAQQKKESEFLAQQQADEEAAAERLQKIEKGRELVNIPKWAKSVIVADFYENESDAMTDYFSTRVCRTVFLAFSRTDRNNEKELREACLNFEEVKDFPALADENTDREYNKVKLNRDQHSYLPDYFLGTSNWYGWKVNKDKYFNLSDEGSRERLYIAAADGRYMIPKQESRPEKVNTAQSDGIEIIDYSDKAIAVIGDTKPIKDDLKSLGGRFNFRLHCGPGWIFPKTKLDEVKTYLSI